MNVFSENGLSENTTDTSVYDNVFTNAELFNTAGDNKILR
jgi:hypothetical protein